MNKAVPVPHFSMCRTLDWLDWPSSLFVASRNVLVSSLYHDVQVKMVVDLRHGTQNL